MTKVTLTEIEQFMAGTVAFFRQLRAQKTQAEHRWGDVNRGWLNNVIGLFAEFAVAKHLGIYWGGGNHDLTLSDVGDYEVRYNSYGDKSFLRIYDQDKPDKKYILVTGEPPVFELRGWLYGREGMLPEYKKTPLNTTPGKECFWVPMDKLYPMADL